MVCELERRMLRVQLFMQGQYDNDGLSSTGRGSSLVSNGCDHANTTPYSQVCSTAASKAFLVTQTGTKGTKKGVVLEIAKFGSFLCCTHTPSSKAQPTVRLR